MEELSVFLDMKRTALSLRDALRVRSAEFWLRLGQQGQALMELQKLPERARRDPWAVKVFRSANRALCGIW